MSHDTRVTPHLPAGSCSPGHPSRRLWWRWGLLVWLCLSSRGRLLHVDRLMARWELADHRQRWSRSRLQRL